MKKNGAYYFEVSMRVDISYNSGIYVPHSNTKEQWAKAVETKIANNTVVFDEEGFLVLPEIKGEEK